MSVGGWRGGVAGGVGRDDAAAAAAHGELGAEWEAA